MSRINIRNLLSFSFTNLSSLFKPILIQKIEIPSRQVCKHFLLVIDICYKFARERIDWLTRLVKRFQQTAAVCQRFLHLILLTNRIAGLGRIVKPIDQHVLNHMSTAFFYWLLRLQQRWREIDEPTWKTIDYVRYGSWIILQTDVVPILQTGAWEQDFANVGTNL